MLQNATKGFFAASIIFFLLLMVGLLAPKYIGVEAILTLQLIFYSCLLIKDSAKFTPGLKTFTYFKLSTGYNDIFSFTTLILSSDITSKYNFLSIKKTVL